MCEPHFSFVQLYDSPEQQNRNRLLFGQQISQSDSPVLNIGKYLHFAKYGSGHTGAYQKVNKQSGWRDSEMYDYECQWWIRKVKLDGPYQNIDFDSLDAAKQYSQRTVIGSLSGLRQFLEQSILKSDRQDLYVCQFVLMLNKCGRDLFFKKSKQFGLDTSEFNLNFKPKIKQKQIAKFLLGFTRKRELLVPEWADDDTLWRSKKQLQTIE